MRYQSIKPSQVLLDTCGQRIQVQGGSLFHQDGSDYRHGENEEKTLRGSGIWLPIRFDGEMPRIDWKNEWRVEDVLK